MLEEGNTAQYTRFANVSDLSSQRTPEGMCVILGFRREVDETQLPSSGLLRSV